MTAAATISEQQGQNDRRVQMWPWQAKQAATELERLHIDTDIARTAMARADAELALHQTQMGQRDALRADVDDKFTNQQLFGWRVGQLTTLDRDGFNVTLPAIVPPYQNLNAVLTHTEYNERDGQKVAAVDVPGFHRRSKIAACLSWIFGVPCPSR